MVNTIIESFRKRTPIYFVDKIEDYIIESPIIKDQNTTIYDTNELHLLIEELPPKYKLVFNLYALEGLTHQEISDILGISIGTSKSNLSRARKILKDKISAKIKSKSQTA